MTTTEHAELHYLTGYQILHEPESETDPVLVLSTEEGDSHFLVTREMFLKLAPSFQKYGESLPEKS